MEITRETNPYNERRYGKPWIALVDFSSSAKGDFAFGEWVGDGRNGGEGTLIINAEPGDIIAIGQKDYRKARNSAPNFYTVTVSGEFEEIGDKGAAYKHYKAMSEKKIDKETLVSERERLVARIAEIDKLLC